MASSRLTSKGQVTIPKAVREALGVGPGDQVEFLRRGDGTVEVVARNRPIEALSGMLADLVPRRRRPVTVEEMDDAIGRHVGALDRATRSARPPRTRRAGGGRAA